MLSVDAVQLRVAPFAPTGAATSPPGREGATVSVDGTGPTGLFPHDAMSDAVASNSSKRMKRNMGTLSQREGPAQRTRNYARSEPNAPKIYRRHMTPV